MMNIKNIIKEHENKLKIKLDKNLPIIIRVDGRNFKKYTRTLNKPFDEDLITTFYMTMQSMCEEIDGCQLGYMQSDEISFLLINYKNENTTPWFGGILQKIVSASASMVTDYFNTHFNGPTHLGNARFDSRAFNIPKELINDYFINRQQNWFTNSLNMIARTKFSHKQLYEKSNEDIKIMLREIGYEYNNIKLFLKYGLTHYKIKNEASGRYSWIESFYNDNDSVIVFEDNPGFINERT